MSLDLAGVKVGDILHVTAHGHVGALVRVTRVTATQVIAGRERYRISDGYRVADTGWGKLRAELATPEQIDAVRRARLISRIASIGSKDVEHVTTPELETAWRLLAPRSVDVPADAKRGGKSPSPINSGEAEE